MKEPRFENQKKYTLPEENIIPLDESSEIRKKKKEYFLGLQDEGIEWLVEIQGGGQSDYEKREFKVHYPVGDIFLSFAVIIHELGHLRQGEIDERFATDVLGAPESKIDELEYHSETESDAWQRGLERAKKYCPEILREMELKFVNHQKEGRLKDFKSFEDFFNYIVKVGLKITELSDEVGIGSEEEIDQKKSGRTLGQLFKKDPLTKKFFAEQERWRSGEIIDQPMIENFIRKMAENIAEEKY